MQHVGPADAEALVRAGGLMLDVRPVDDYERAHIPGARSAPLDALSFDDAAQKAAPFRDQTVILYCRDEDCLEAPRACEQLWALGYESVYILDGGSVGWWRSGRPLEGAQVEAHMRGLEEHR